MKKNRIIKVTLTSRTFTRNAHDDNIDIWDADKGEWDDYTYGDGMAFIIKKDGEQVGIYNMNSVVSIVIK